MKTLTIKCLLILIITFSFNRCKKEFLEKKPNTGIVVPVTLDDMRQLLDNYEINRNNSPTLGIVSADEYYYSSTEAYEAAPTKTQKNAFIWNTEIYTGETKISDWNAPYQTIFYANVVLEQLDKLQIEDKNSVQGKYIKAWALFNRSFAFYNLVQIFSPAYNEVTASTDLGIPLKLTANINDIQKRSTVQETYDRILSDLESSIPSYTDAFPDKFPARASKAAAYALLARIYLSMNKFKEALNNAEKCLELKNSLMDYNTLDQNTNAPFSKFNAELILFNEGTTSYPTFALVYGSAFISHSLIALYDSNDLRKSLFFNKQNENYIMKYMYAGDGELWPFTGLAVDEVYLIKAECVARLGNYNAGMDVLNALLLKRYKFDAVTNKSTYVNQTASSMEDALQNILSERRKELVWRGLRWSDLKRLNIAGANITLSRDLGGKTYTLPPNDPRYVMPIPDDEIAISHVKQNIR
jgi:hypothetical protein